jgi:hypothetical protein
MRVLSATEAIAPAWKRTWEILFKPFRFGRSWKWGASAYVGQLGFCCTPFFLILPIFIPVILSALPGIPKGALIGACLAGVVLSSLSFLLYYLGARMQFVLLEAIATRATHVAPLWRQYGSRTWKWIRITIIPLSVFSILASIPIGISYVQIFRNMPQPGAHMRSPFAGFEQMIMLDLMVFLCMGIMVVIASIMGDFLLPSIALEDASASTALARLRDIVAEEPGQMLAFLLLKLALLPVILMGWYMALIVLMLITMIPFGIVALLSWLIFHGMGIAGHVILIVELVIGYILFFAWFLYVEIGSIGILPMFMQTYGIYFFGGRYQPLGDILEPPVVEAPPPTIEMPGFETPLPEGMA